ncbi:MAG: acyloxyacyl hydrolase [Muribaculaceae bacterium]|nr:acyloxyacyl hydrolase [Muribaculaceae bacterium]
MNKIVVIIFFACLCACSGLASDSIPSGFSRIPEWRVGVEASPAWVPGTSGFLKGNNPDDKRIGSGLSGGVRADFSFNPSTREGILYRGVYQGLGVGVSTYFSPRLLGTPISVYAYQGAPIARFSDRVWLGYEWQFGAAFAWKHFDAQTPDNNAVISTPVTAHMGLGLKLHYNLSERWAMTVGVAARHYSNGNTSWPNKGLNSLGVTLGIEYILNPCRETPAIRDAGIFEDADRGKWLFDVMAYGAWRKRVVSIGDPAEPQLCPGKFGILGLQLSPLRRLNRWVSFGPSLDLQWDESAGLSPYWVEGTLDDMVKFVRPPFGKQLSVGVSVRAELTMPIFSVNGGIGFNVVNPKGDRAFYQLLNLKTFITKNIYINTGYSLGKFQDPRNLMLGVGFRL